MSLALGVARGAGSPGASLSTGSGALFSSQAEQHRFHAEQGLEVDVNPGMTFGQATSPGRSTGMDSPGQAQRSAAVEAFTGIRRSRTGGTPSRVAGAPCSWTEARAASPVRQIYANWGTGTGLTGRTSPGPSRQSPTAIASDLFAGEGRMVTRSAAQDMQGSDLLESGGAVRAGACCISKDAPTVSAEQYRSSTPGRHAIMPANRLATSSSASRHSPAAVADADPRQCAIFKEAVTNIQVDPPDLTVILEAIARIEAKVSAGFGMDMDPLMSRLDRIEDHHRNFSVEPVLTAIQDIHGKHHEVLQAIGGVSTAPDMSHVHQAVERLDVHGRHVELLDAVNQLHSRQQHVDLAPLHSAIEGMHGRHQEVIDAVSRIVVDPVDLTPVHQRLNDLARGMEDVFEEIRRSNAETRAEIEALRNGQELPVFPSHDDIAARLHERLTEHEAVMSRPQAVDLDPLHQQIRTLHEAVRGIDMPVYDHSEVLNAIDKIVIEIDYDAIAARVHERFTSHHSEVLDAVTNIQVEPTDMGPVVDAIRESEQGMMREIRGIRFDIDYDALADAVHGRVSSHDFGHTEVLKAINEIRIEGPDHEAIAERVHARVTEHDFGHDSRHDEVMRAVSSIPKPDHDEIADRLHAKVMSHDFGHGEVLRAVKDAEVDVDHVAEAVHSRLRNQHGEVLRSITSIKIDEPDLTPILEAIRRMEVDLQPVYDALAKMSARLDPSELLAAINRLRLDVDYHHIGDIVAERAPRADNTEVLQAIRRLRFDPPDYGQVADLVQRRIEPRQSEILAAVGKIRVPELDVTPIMHSISSVKAELVPIVDAIRSIRIPKLSATEVADEVVAAIQSLGPQFDAGAVAEAVFQKIRGGDFGHSKVLQALKGLEPRDIDYAEISATVSRAVPRSDNSEVLRALSNLNFRVDMSEVMQAVLGVKQLIDQLRGDLRARPQVVVHDKEVLPPTVHVEKIVHAPKSMPVTTTLVPQVASAVVEPRAIARVVEPLPQGPPTPRSFPAVREPVARNY